MIRAVILDLDGTLVDTKEMIYDLHFKAAEKMGLPKVHFRTSSCYNGSWEEAIQRMWPNVDVEEFKRVFRSLPQDKCNAVPETVDALKELKGNYVLGIVTGKLTQRAIKQLKECGFETDWFEFIYGDEGTGITKPDGRVFDNALKELNEKGISKEEVIYVGDSVMDEMACEQAGISFIGVLTGFAGEKDFKECRIIPSVAKLPAVI